MGFSAVAESRGHSLVAVRGPPTAVAALVAEGLWGARASGVVLPGLQSTGSIVAVRRPSCSTACGIFPGQGCNPRLL